MKIKKSISIVLIIFFPLLLFSQNYEKKAEDAINRCDYKSATEYYQKAFEKELNNKNFDLAETCLDNILTIDPNNKFVETKRQELKNKKKQNNQKERRHRVSRNTGHLENFMLGFLGSYSRHSYFGGFHYKIGMNYINATRFDNNTSDKGNGFTTGLFYNNSRYFPITLELDLSVGDLYYAINLGLFSNYFITNFFAIKYGGGYKISQLDFTNNIYDNTSPFLRLGATVMFDEEYFGGISYYCERGFSSEPQPLVHNFTYIAGTKPTLWLTSLALIIGLVAIAGS